MNKFYIIGACVLAIGSVCIQVSNGATTSSPPVTTGSQTEATSEVPTTSGVTGSQTEATSEVPTTSGVTASTPAGVTDVITDVLNNATACPRFTTRLVNETLYIAYVEGRCEMVVTVDRFSLPSVNSKGRKRTIKVPVVTFRPVEVEQNGEPVSCESLPNRSLGPFVFVDTVEGDCQMLLKVQKQKNEAYVPRVPGEKRPWKGSWNRPGKDSGNRPRNPRFLSVPAFEYLDEIMY